jgi:hypothetical protein
MDSTQAGCINIAYYIYEDGKQHPIGAILENGQCIDFDPWDIAALFDITCCADAKRKPS